MTSEGTFPKVNGDIYYEQDANLSYGWFDMCNNAGNAESILCFSSTVWQTINNDTTDGGTTWSAGGYSQAYATICRANRAKAINWSGTTIKWTINSGSTWTDDTTPPANIVTSNDCCFNIEGRAYMAGDTAGTTGLWYSTNYGDDWTQCAGAFGSFNAVCMHDATHGLAIDDANNIYFTTNGTTWDSTHQHTGIADKGYAIHITASGATIGDFIAYIVDRTTGTDGTVRKYIGTGNDSIILQINISGATQRATDFYKATNGDAVLVYAVPNISNNNNYRHYLLRLPNGASTFQTRTVMLLGSNATEQGDGIVEYDTNKMLVCANNGTIYKFYMSS